LCTLVRRQLVRRPEAESSAVHVEHDRTPSGQARRPDVQLEHVLTLPAIIPILNESLLRARPGVQVLRAICSINKRWIFVSPWCGRLGRKPPILSGGRLPVGNPLECDNTPVDKSAHLPGPGIGHCRARGRADARPFAGCSLDAVGTECTLSCNAHSCGGREKQRLSAGENNGLSHELVLLCGYCLRGQAGTQFR